MPQRHDSSRLTPEEAAVQCGPIRHTAATPAGAPHALEVVPRACHARIDLPQDAGIQNVF